MTEEAAAALADADYVIGSGRMLDLARGKNRFWTNIAVRSSRTISTHTARMNVSRCCFPETPDFTAGQKAL